MGISQRHSPLHLYCEGVIEASWLAVLVLVPSFFVALSDRSFEPPKAVLVQSLVLLASAAWLLKVLVGGRPAAAWSEAGSDAGDVRPKGSLLPAAVLVWTVVLLAATVASLDPGLSWRGSYERGFGSAARLAPVVLFWLLVSHLRTTAQRRRIAFALLGGALPVCLLALLQRLGVDPLAFRPPTARPETSLGNPIFLGAYLCLALFLSAALALEAGWLEATRSPWQGFRRGVVVALLGLQAVTLVLAASRGPTLGLMGGLLLYGLWAARRGSGSAEASPPHRRRLRILLLLLASILVLGILLLQRPDTAGAGRRSGVERLTSLLTLDSKSVLVRRYVWLSGLRALSSDTPLLSNVGSDPRHAARRWIGFGPEASAFALDRHKDPRLNPLERDKVPDRAHNRTLQAALDGGLLGLVAWGFLLLATADTAAVTLFSPSRRARLGWMAGLMAAAAGGALLAGLLAPELVMLGATGAAGLVFGALLLIGPRRGAEGDRPLAGGGPAAALLVAGIGAHLVEGQFGIETVAGSLLAWVGLALLWLSRPTAAATRDGTDGRPPSIGAGAGTLTLLLLTYLCYVLMVGRLGAQAEAGLLTRPRWSVWWLLATTLLVCWTLAADRPTLRSLARLASPALLLLGPSLLLLSALLPTSGAPLEPGGIFRREAILAQSLFALLVLLTLALGWRLAASRRLRLDRAALAMTLVLGLLGIVAAVTLTRTIRVGIAVKMAQRAETRLLTGAALDLLQRGARLAPDEAHLPLLRGRLASAALARERAPERRQELLRIAGESLETAARLSPYDADHVANRGRHLAERARRTASEEESRDLLARAGETFRRALLMRPSSPALRVDLAGVEEVRGETSEALRLLEEAHRLDPRDLRPLRAEIELRRSLLRRPETAGTPQEAAHRRRLEELLPRLRELEAARAARERAAR